MRKKQVVNKASESLPANTTEQEDIVTAGQRRINIIWEVTQAMIAVTVTAALIYVSIHRIDSEELKKIYDNTTPFTLARSNCSQHLR